MISIENNINFVFIQRAKTFSLPLFQLYSFLTRTFPLGLKGPCSTNAPAPTEEQPGPS